MSEKDTYRIFRQLEERQKRANPYKFYDKDELIDEILKNEDEIERLNNIINEFNSSYSKIIKECEEMINDRFYMNDNAIKYHANRIRDIAKYYIEEPKWQELKGNTNEKD